MEEKLPSQTLKVQILNELEQHIDFVIKTAFHFTCQFDNHQIDEGETELSHDKLNQLKTNMVGVINKFYYKQDFHFLDLVNHFFWSFLHSHKLKSGNKSFATVLLFCILGFCYGNVNQNKQVFDVQFETPCRNDINQFMTEFESLEAHHFDTNGNIRKVLSSIKNWLLGGLKSNSQASLEAILTNDQQILENMQVNSSQPTTFMNFMQDWFDSNHSLGIRTTLNEFSDHLQ